MNWMTSSLALLLRSRLREHPFLHRTAGHVLSAALRNTRGYELRFSAELTSAVRRGDCVWDVGANMGLYTSRFLDQVGSDGTVVAFEPSPACARHIAALGNEPRLLVAPIALTDYDGSALFSIADGETAPSNHITTSTDRSYPVRCSRGTSLVKDGWPPPHVIKIDVEGYEGEVLDGIVELLQTVRPVFIEVHFAALASRGQPEAPNRIVKVLREYGMRTRWLDASHLCAFARSQLS